MSIAPLLLAFLSVAGVPPSESSCGAVLLNFHAQWCGPCHKAPPAVEQLIREGYPVKRIDIDEEPDLPSERYRVEGVPAFIVVDRDGRELGRLSGPRSAGDLAHFYKTSGRQGTAPGECVGRTATAAPRTMKTQPLNAMTTRIAAEGGELSFGRMTSQTAPRKPSRIPSRGRRSCASASSATVRRDLDRAP